MSTRTTPGARRDLHQEHQQRRCLLADLPEVKELLELVHDQHPDRHVVPGIAGNLAGQLAFRADVRGQLAQPLVAVLDVGLDAQQRLGEYLDGQARPGRVSPNAQRSETMANFRQYG